ncbi:MAG: YfhO family protein [Lachnospiraceae bacterium]|nr:YfhO family protein [Lachnospiraceae bacterium]
MNRVRSFNEIAAEEGRKRNRPFSAFPKGKGPFSFLSAHLFPYTGLPGPLVLFVLAFCMYLLAVLPVLIMHKGLFFYYGDYNVQQVPFYILAHRLIRSGRFFYTLQLDLGGTVAGDFAFYLTGSPFFWLTLPFPERVLPYLMPYLMGLKYACSALTSYLWIRRHTGTESSARLGALLYAFSGFAAVNIVFHHFTDATCFFPLLILTFDDLMAVSEKEHMEDRFREAFLPWLKFALTVTLLAVINYYFFFGMVLFLLLYAVLRHVRKHTLRLLPKKIGSALSAGVTGMLLAAGYLVIAMTGVAGNTRLDNLLSGYELLVYPDAKMYFDILKNMVMTPDIIGRGTIFYSTAVKNSSLAGYLPMFGIAGGAVFLHMKRRKIRWLSRILGASVVCAALPVLNGAFSMLNTHYYARWYYMPLLFLALATSLAIERAQKKDMRFGVLLQTGCFLFMVLVFFLPSKDAEGQWEWLHMSENPEYFILDAIVSAVLTLLLIVAVFLIRRRGARIRVLYALSVIASVTLTMNVVAKGKTLISNYGMEMWKLQMLDTRPSLPEDAGVFYRVDTDDTATNYEMVWGYPTVHCFLSTVPGEIFTFYEGAAGITRLVESELPLVRDGIRALLSVRYYIWNSEIYEEGEFGKGEGIYGFDETVFEGNGLTVFENKNYIPPGTTFEYYIRESDFDGLDKKNNDRLLVRALILSDEDADRYGHLMEELPVSYRSAYVSDPVFDALCRERARSACTYFAETDSGYRARTSYLEKETLVFFPIPASGGFTITVDGEEVPVIRADYGLTAVPVPAGIHEIEARFVPPYLEQGAMCSFAGVMICMLYGLYHMGRTAKKEKRETI